MKLLKKLRIRISLTAIVTMVVAVSVGSISYLTLKTVYEQKQRDAWAIIFLQLERQGNQIGTYLNKTTRQVAAKPADIMLKVDGLSLVPVRGELQAKFPMLVLGLDKLDALSENSVVTLGGRSYLARVGTFPAAFAVEGTNLAAGTYLSLWRIRLAEVGGWPSRSGDTLSYVVTSQGKLAYASDASVAKDGFLQRDLVQRFISMPMRQGQMTFKRPDGHLANGFYQEVEGSNLVLFSETTRDAAQIATFGAVRTVFIAVLVIMLLSAAILQQSLAFQSRALRRFSMTVAQAVDRPEVNSVDMPDATDLVPLAMAVNALMAARPGVSPFAGPDDGFDLVQGRP